MYFYKYYRYSWTNYKDPTLQRLQTIIGELDYEEYIFSLIVKNGLTDIEIDNIIKDIGYIPDYILERNTGVVKLLHQTTHMDILSTKGYVLTDIDNGEGNYSFGRGVYALLKDNFTESDSWTKRNDVYEGIYTGEYLKCIEDTSNGLKCGNVNKFQQEIIIPFDELDIKWKI